MNEKSVQTKAELLREEQRERDVKGIIRTCRPICGPRPSKLTGRCTSRRRLGRDERASLCQSASSVVAQLEAMAQHFRSWRRRDRLANASSSERTPSAWYSLKDITKALTGRITVDKRDEEATWPRTTLRPPQVQRRKKSSRSCWRASSPERRSSGVARAAASPRECSSAGGRSSALAKRKRLNVGVGATWTADHPIGHQGQFCCKDCCRRPAE